MRVMQLIQGMKTTPSGDPAVCRKSLLPLKQAVFTKAFYKLLQADVLAPAFSLCPNPVPLPFTNS